MNEKNTPINDFAELAALYAAGALGQTEAATFEALVASNPQAAAELRALEPALDVLTEAPDAIAPSPRIRATLLDRIASSERDANTGNTPAATEHADDHEHGRINPQVWKHWAQQAASNELYTRRSDEGDWEETGEPGVQVRRLFMDPERDQFTAIVRMAPGTAWPRHIHNGAEECLVIQGDLRVGDITMRTGDYQRAPAGSRHGVQSTENGCLLLIMSSLSDEMF